MDVLKCLNRMADEAKMHARPPPVIKTDVWSALILSRAIEDGIGAINYDPSVRTEAHVVAMYDGIKIVTEAWRPDQGGFHEHFGALAEIYSGGSNA